MVGHGKARLGGVRRGVAGLGQARRVMARFFGCSVRIGSGNLLEHGTAM